MTSDDDQPATHAAPNEDVPAAGTPQPADPEGGGRERRAPARAGSALDRSVGRKTPRPSPDRQASFCLRAARRSGRSAEFEHAAAENAAAENTAAESSTAGDVPTTHHQAAGQVPVAADAAIAQGETVSAGLPSSATAGPAAAAWPSSATAGPAAAAESQPRADRKADDEKPGGAAAATGVPRMTKCRSSSRFARPQGGTARHPPRS